MALSTPLSVTGTPKKLDEQLPGQLAEFVEAHLGLCSTLESAKQRCPQSCKRSSQEAPNSKSQGGPSRTSTSTANVPRESDTKQSLAYIKGQVIIAPSFKMRSVIIPIAASRIIDWTEPQGPFSLCAMHTRSEEAVYRGRTLAAMPRTNTIRRSFIRAGIRTAPGCLAVCVITYICYHLRLNLSITGFVYLIVVVLQSLVGSFGSSAAVSLVAVLCLDFFFTPPVFSFEVTDPLDILALISFLTTGLVITRLTTKARNANHAAAAAQAESFRGAILDALAHEFKTPLATIVTAAGGLRELGPLCPEQLELTDTVETEAVRLSLLTSRLLRTAQLGSRTSLSRNWNLPTWPT